jgi:hypothetical protein
MPQHAQPRFDALDQVTAFKDFTRYSLARDLTDDQRRDAAQEADRLRAQIGRTRALAALRALQDELDERAADGAAAGNPSRRFVGVRHYADRRHAQRPYQAVLTHRGRKFSAGYYATEAEAARAHDAAAHRLGLTDPRRLNFPSWRPA